MTQWIYVDVIEQDSTTLQLVNADHVVRARSAPDIAVKGTATPTVRGTLMLYMDAGGGLRVFGTLDAFKRKLGPQHYKQDPTGSFTLPEVERAAADADPEGG